MGDLHGLAKTFLQHGVEGRLRSFFDTLFKDPNLEQLVPAVVDHLLKDSLIKEDYPLVSGSYSRNIVSRAENGFEAMVARWSVGTVTAVHGHPDYALYLLVEGKLGVEYFIQTKKGPKFTGKQIMYPGEHFCMQGSPDTFDNAIHRITALQESLSVHVYSDDALKGLCFSDYPGQTPFNRGADDVPKVESLP